GGSSGKSIKYDPKNRYIVTVRDLGEYAHIGGPTYLGASLILNSISTPLNPGNPYVNSKTQVGSAATFALGHLQALLNLGTSRVIRASYWQKYYVHRILRPEAYGGLIYNNIVNRTQYPINSEVLNSQALAQTFSTFGTYLLPQAYPEASPIHSSYTGGAAANAGVNITLLKAFFDENFVIPSPVVPDPNDPTKVIPYSGPPLTVGGELNKLATNYAIGRGHGGIHWRSDGSAALALGEEVAISLLRDERLGYNERFNGFTFTKFDGTKVTV
ncbi:vanadium-dependent haloperoxidase, partial [Nostoc sp. CHAB 5715]|uniref:vanadium-dependent haloperoxidase n=1 Tax=Nostoc sp. CHAB 5715 TaxID=2780400 RepID=UPI001E522F63